MNTFKVLIVVEDDEKADDGAAYLYPPKTIESLYELSKTRPSPALSLFESPLST
jgi:hypothetical protein